MRSVSVRAVATAVAAGLLVVLIAADPANSGVLCRWFGRCVYESPGFRIVVTDRETGHPLPDVHALAEWQMYAAGRLNGPLMVQDTVSDADGLLTFPAWGPIQGAREGLVISSNPVVTLFKSGYRPLILNNAYPLAAEETDRVHGFDQGAQSSAMEPFRGTPAEWVAQLDRVWRGLAFSRHEADTQRFRDAYRNRALRVWAEQNTVPEAHRVPPGFRTPPGFFWFVDEELKRLGAEPK